MAVVSPDQMQMIEASLSYSYSYFSLSLMGINPFSFHLIYYELLLEEAGLIVHSARTYVRRHFSTAHCTNKAHRQQKQKEKNNFDLKRRH